MTDDLGRVIGRILDRSASTESGSAVVLHVDEGGTEDPQPDDLFVRP